MKRLIALDLDNTLAPVGQPIMPETIALLRRLESRGDILAICSGKPTYYLCGLLRQAALQQPILLGENGAVLQFGVQLPPETFHILPYSPAAKASIALLKTHLTDRLPHLWYQPNLVGLTPFPVTEAEFDTIEQCIRELQDQLSDITVYRHADSFDIMPSNLHKGAGLHYLGDLLTIPPERTIAVGDGPNDYPMFQYAGHGVGIGSVDSAQVDRVFVTIDEALRYLLAMQEPHI